MYKTTLENLNITLAPYGAKISVENGCLQSKSEGYIGEQFQHDKRPVYDFDVVCNKTGLSFANVNSPIYRKLPKETKDFFFNSYFETKQRIYC